MVAKTPSVVVANDVTGAPFSEQGCVGFLKQTQNADGGWGFKPGLSSAVEPTSWALLALLPFVDESSLNDCAERARQWLLQAQLPDGAWPAFTSQTIGCWLTSLACLALRESGGEADSVSAGMKWLCNSWPGEGALWWRIGHFLKRGGKVSSQDSSLRGWSWTPKTASWVEPTSLALLLLKSYSEAVLPKNARRRIQIAEAMLYDRMCPGGGWNAGNPLVYNVAGDSLVGPTVWALLALEDHRDRAQNKQSLAWLESVYNEIRGPGSLALAHVCLKAHGRALPSVEPALRSQFERNGFLRNVVVASWALIACKGMPSWLLVSREGYEVTRR